MKLNKSEQEFLERCRAVDFSADVNKEQMLRNLLEKLHKESKLNKEGDYEDFNNRR
ncbi:MAG: hypothetical protein FWF81_01655 [Defluviitaleaceae bacterium]|nr:hypothetical protein [Defluviitaleaceae bacterium]